MTDQKSRDSFFAERVRNASPSPTLAVSQRARELRADGIDVIDLGGGDPDFITPQHIREAAINAMNSGDTHYVPSKGTPQLLEAIANKLQADNGIAVNPNTDIIVTPGGKSAIYQAIMSFVEPGVDVMLFEPAWVSYQPMVELAGGRAIGVPLNPDDNFAITSEVLEQHVTPETRVILLNSPNNPSGRVATKEELTAIADFAKAHDILVFTDEIRTQDGLFLLRRALANLSDLLAGEGASLADVVKTTVFLTSMGDYGEMNRIYTETFGDSRPARSAVAVAALPLGALVEIEAMAWV